MMPRSKEGKGSVLNLKGKSPFTTQPPSQSPSHPASQTGSRHGGLDAAPATSPDHSQPLTQEALAEWHRQQIEMYNRTMSGGVPAAPLELPPGIPGDDHEEFDIDQGKTDSNPAASVFVLAPIVGGLLPIDLDDDDDNAENVKDQEDNKSKEGQAIGRAQPGPDQEAKSKEDSEDVRELRLQLRVLEKSQWKTRDVEAAGHSD